MFRASLNELPADIPYELSSQFPRSHAEIAFDEIGRPRLTDSKKRCLTRRTPAGGSGRYAIILPVLP